MKMSAIDSETPSPPPRREPAHRAARWKGRDSIERYVALEFPRETVRWLLNSPASEDWRIREGLAPSAGNRVRATILPPRGL